MQKDGDKLVYFLSDQHYAPADDACGGVDEAAESVALQIAKLAKPDIFVNLGDAGEWTAVSPWQYKRRKRPPLTYVLKDAQRDVEAINKSLDKWDKVLPDNCEKHFLEGNHEVWCDNLLEECPELGEQWSVQELLKLRARSFNYHPYGKYLKLGSLRTYHGGHVTGINHTYKHLNLLGCPVLYGHYHDIEVSKRSTIDGAIGAWSVGCIAKLQKPFLKGRPTNWGQGIGIAYLHADGTFNVQVVEIYEGVAHFNGRKVTA